MLRLPSASNAQASLSPRFETVSSEGKGELITCSSVNDWAVAGVAVTHHIASKRKADPIVRCSIGDTPVDCSASKQLRRVKRAILTPIEPDATPPGSRRWLQPSASI